MTGHEGDEGDGALIDCNGGFMPVCAWEDSLDSMQELAWRMSAVITRQALQCLRDLGSTSSGGAFFSVDTPTKVGAHTDVDALAWWLLEAYRDRVAVMLSLCTRCVTLRSRGTASTRLSASLFDRCIGIQRILLIEETRQAASVLPHAGGRRTRRASVFTHYVSV